MFFLCNAISKTQMINIYTNEKWEQIMTYRFGKTFCFFLFFISGVLFSQEVNLEKSSNYKKLNNQCSAIDSCHSSIHTLGGAIIIDYTNKKKQQSIVSSKKTIRVNKTIYKRQFSKKISAVKYYNSGSIFHIYLINKTKVFYDSSFLQYYIVFVSNNLPKHKIALLAIVLFVSFIFTLNILKNKSLNVFSRNLFFNSYHFSRPPPFL